MSYFLAPSLVVLRDEANAAFPRRDKTSDGWIGDASHAARPSSHNPDWHAPGRRNGVVRAVDIDIDDNDPRRDLRRELLNALIGDPRVWYVISNGIIYSRTYGWQARRYAGSNPHFTHVHVSILETEAAEFDTRPWLEVRRKTRPRVVDVSNIHEQFMIAAGAQRGQVRDLPGVARVQRGLSSELGRKVAADGIVGPDTLRAWADFEARADVPGVGRPRVPDWPSLRILARGRFRLVA